MLASRIAMLVITASTVVPALSTPLPSHSISDFVVRGDDSLVAARVPGPFGIDETFSDPRRDA